MKEDHSQRRIKPPVADIRFMLWNENADLAEDSQAYLALIEQYKLYVEMADRVSQKRGFTNTFFLSFNSIIFTSIGLAVANGIQVISAGALILLLIVAVGQCGAWWLLVRSYSQLNAAKYRVIGLLEERLPASPYWSAEWMALGEGKNLRRYVPISHIELSVPVFFAFAYTAGFILVLNSYSSP